MLNLDTHILIKALQGDLTQKERTVLQSDPDWGISGIVLWEIEKLFELGRLRFGLDHPALATAVDRLTIWPISREVCLAFRLLDFRSDPADEIIAATSLAMGVSLLTRDARIRSSRVVPLA